jgi:hypothetical protein
LGDDPDYLMGFRAAIPAAFDYSLIVIESGEGVPPPIPAQIIAQARLAARSRVGLDAVLRGYVAGSIRMDDFILDECDGTNVQSLLRSRAVALEHLLSRVSAEYEAEQRLQNNSRDAWALERVRKLLHGEPQSSADLNYDLTLNHVGLVARGDGSKQSIAKLARSMDSRILLVEVDSETVWAWLGRRGPIHVEELQGKLTEGDPGVSVGIGEPAVAIAGWRRTHQQARVALPVALSSSTTVARYSDVCLIASAMQDTLLKSSLKELYLQPLLVGRDGGASHIQTLRAYFAAHRNRNSTASILGISRQAVSNRLRVVEERLGQSLPSCAAAIEIALRLDEAKEAAPIDATVAQETQ